jgi:hypothetical protein
MGETLNENEFCPHCEAYGNVHDPDKHGLNENLIQAEVLNRTATQAEKDKAKVMWDEIPEWRKEAIREEIEMDLW